MSTSLQPVPRPAAAAIEITPPSDIWVPTNFREALEFADYLSKSDLVPKDYRNKPANVFVAMQHGREIGLSPMQAIQSIANINGRPGLFGDVLLAVCMAHPAFETIKEWVEGDGETMIAHCQVKRRGHEIHEQTFSVFDAKRANLWDERPKIKARDSNAEYPNPSPWYCYPRRMLMFRARGFALRDKFPDALRGMISREELDDYPGGPTIDAANYAAPATTVTTATTQTAEPADSVISGEEIDQFTQAVKVTGKTRDVVRAWMKANLTTLKGTPVETSTQIRRSEFAKAMAFANSTREAPPAAASSGTPSTAAPTASTASPAAVTTKPTTAPTADAPQGDSGSSTSVFSSEQSEQSQASIDEKEANVGFEILGWDKKVRERFVEQYGNDWAKIKSEVSILVERHTAD